MSRGNSTLPPVEVPKVTAAEILALSGNHARSRLETAAGIGSLLVTSLRLAVRHPTSWWRESLVEASLMLRRSVVPLVISISVFTVAIGFFVLGGVTTALGASDRLGGAVIIAFIREAAYWTAGMIFAGVAGSAMAADLAARKVRDELDALQVFGLDHIRVLVVPKVMASVLVAFVLGMVALVAAEVINFGLAPMTFEYSDAVLYQGTKGSLIAMDVYGSIFRYVVTGLGVAAIACYKGLSSQGGTEGVGRAVNETVVLSFFSIFMFDAFFNVGFLSLFPEAQVGFKG